MSSLGANYSADGATPAPATTDTPAPAARLNVHPTVIVLDTPYSLGDIAPDTKFPHVYITTFYVNGPVLHVDINYEVGTMTEDGWQKMPLASTSQCTLNGMDLLPFFSTVPTDTTTPLWSQVEELLYKQVQASDARMAGSVVTL